MSLPEGVTAATLTAKITKTSSSSPITISVSIAPSVDVTHAESGIRLVDLIETLASGPGPSKFVLPHSSQAGFVDESGDPVSKWYYIATVNSRTLDGRQAYAPQTKAFQLPAGITTIDLELLPTYQPSPADRPTPTPAPSGGGGSGIGIVINEVPVVPDLVPVDGPNTTAESWFGEGAFASVLTFTPSRDIRGVLYFDFGPDYVLPPDTYGDGDFEVFDSDPWTNSGIDPITYVYNTPTAFAFLAGTTYYLAWIDWSAPEDKTIDRGPIHQRLLAYDLDGVLADDGMYLPHVHTNSTVDWLRFDAPTGTDGAWTEGKDNVASGPASHAEGVNNTASGVASHAEGSSSQATGHFSHSEGAAIASGQYAHAENAGHATGQHSHAENQGTASGVFSHAQGFATAQEPAEDAMGLDRASRHTIPKTVDPSASVDWAIGLPLGAGETQAACTIKGTVVAHYQGAVKMWEISAVMFRFGTESEYGLFGTPTVTVLGADITTSGWTVTATLNTADGLHVVGSSGGPAARWDAIFTRDDFMAGLT